ncbi:MAG: hypothetical protein QXD11_00215 [Candidatus Micrarchaeaceae archaeon]
MASAQLLVKDKQAKILLTLKDTQQEWYISTLAKKTQTTYVHVHRFINSCEKIGIISIEKHGKLKTVKLTDRGNKLVDSLKNIYSLTEASESHIPSIQ